MQSAMLCTIDSTGIEGILRQTGSSCCHENEI